VHLVRAQGEHVDGELVYVYGYLSDSLRTVAMEQRSLLVHYLADLLCTLDGADLVVRQLDRDQQRIVIHRPLKYRQIHVSQPVYGQDDYLEPLLSQPSAGL
jgi:hypothetical protein